MKIALSVLAACGLMLAGCTAASSQKDEPSTQPSPPQSMPTTVVPGEPVRPEDAKTIVIRPPEVTGSGWVITAIGDKVGTFLAAYTDKAEAEVCRDKLWALVTAGQTIYSADSNGANQAC